LNFNTINIANNNSNANNSVLSDSKLYPIEKSNNTNSNNYFKKDFLDLADISITKRLNQYIDYFEDIQKEREKNGFLFDSDISSASSFESLNSFTLSSFSSDELKYSNFNDEAEYTDEHIIIIENKLPYAKRIDNDNISQSKSGYNLRSNSRNRNNKNFKCSTSKNNLLYSDSIGGIHNPIVIDSIEIIDEPEIIESNTNSPLRRENTDDDIVEIIGEVINNSKRKGTNRKLKKPKNKKKDYLKNL
jgi:hypothetical protein